VSGYISKNQMAFAVDKLLVAQEMIIGLVVKAIDPLTL
jgi:hypothetical protein